MRSARSRRRSVEQRTRGASFQNARVSFTSPLFRSLFAWMRAPRRCRSARTAGDGLFPSRPIAACPLARLFASRPRRGRRPPLFSTSSLAVPWAPFPFCSPLNPFASPSLLPFVLSAHERVEGRVAPPRARSKGPPPTPMRTLHRYSPAPTALATRPGSRAAVTLTSTPTGSAAPPQQPSEPSARPPRIRTCFSAFLADETAGKRPNCLRLPATNALLPSPTAFRPGSRARP